MLNFSVKVDMTDPVPGVVTDGQEEDNDISFSSDTASCYSHWRNFTDIESNIDMYKVTVNVNDEPQKSFELSGDVEYFEDHSLHFEHGDEVQVYMDFNIQWMHMILLFCIEKIIEVVMILNLI